MSAALTLSVETETLMRLQRAAAARNMTPAALAEAALELFLETASLEPDAPLQDWQRERTLRGIADADRGAFVGAQEIDRIRGKYDR